MFSTDFRIVCTDTVRRTVRHHSLAKNVLVGAVVRHEYEPYHTLYPTLRYEERYGEVSTVRSVVPEMAVRYGVRYGGVASKYMIRMRPGPHHALGVRHTSLHGALHTTRVGRQQRSCADILGETDAMSVHDMMHCCRTRMPTPQKTTGSTYRQLKVWETVPSAYREGVYWEGVKNSVRELWQRKRADSTLVALA